MPVNRWELQKSIPPVSGSTFEISISTGWQYEACATPTATLKRSAAGSTGRSKLAGSTGIAQTRPDVGAHREADGRGELVVDLVDLVVPEPLPLVLVQPAVAVVEHELVRHRVEQDVAEAFEARRQARRVVDAWPARHTQ